MYLKRAMEIDHMVALRMKSEKVRFTRFLGLRKKTRKVKKRFTAPMRMSRISIIGTAERFIQVSGSRE